MSVVLLVAAMLGPGPISKFDDHKVDAEYRSPSKLEDIERCMIDADGPGLPNVYRQPDRPDQVTLIWTAKGPLSAPTIARMDIVRAENGAAIKVWGVKKWAESCAPR